VRENIQTLVRRLGAGGCPICSRHGDALSLLGEVHTYLCTEHRNEWDLYASGLPEIRDYYIAYCEMEHAIRVTGCDFKEVVDNMLQAKRTWRRIAMEWLTRHKGREIPPEPEEEKTE
jgi:hypothetical protein